MARRKRRSWFGKSNKKKATPRRKPFMEPLEARQLLTTVSFQQGVSGYEGQEDTVLYSREADTNFGTEGSISPDQQDSNGARQGLMVFNDIIGPASSGQIPAGARINSATLVVDVVNDSNSAMQMSLYRMQEAWSEATATWNTFGTIGGVQASEGEASDLPPDAVLFDPDTSAASSGAGIFDVTRSLEYWTAGADNNGWMFDSSATNGWDFRTKESAVSQRPRLTVDYTIPASDQFQLLNSRIVAAEGDTGTTTALVEVARLGSLSGSASIDYSITAGTASAADFTATSGTLSFGPGQAYATVSVDITGDTELEGLETVDVALSGSGAVAGRDTAVIEIGDNDALINEVLANVSSSSQSEENREYIELIGTPGASLDDYYFVVFDAEEEGDSGEFDDGQNTGVADYVYDLSGATFGTNGLLVIAGTSWEYQGPAAAAGTNIINTASLDGAGGVLEDSSQTYALIRSASPIVQGTDYDTVGAYENSSNVAIGTGVGILDQLPAGAQLVDSVGVVEGGGGDRDRTLTTSDQGHPGVHVHQPTGSPESDGRVTSDAVSRRAGVTIPNSIGVWFNGDIDNADGSAGPIEYLNDTYFVSVVTPDGAVLTPGLPNTLRTVFFSVDDQSLEVAEASGSVTVTIERTGDLSESVDVTYSTVDLGSATPGVDFTAVTDQTITLGPGVASQDVTITILGDSVAEGFERFGLEITDASGDYLITNGRSTQFGAINGLSTVTVADANVQIATFQNGVGGYSGTNDGYIDGEQIFDKFGQDPVIRVDQVKGEGEDVPSIIRPQHGLIEFQDMFGSAAGQVPVGSTIFGAFLTVNVQNNSSGAEVNFFPMLQPWEEVNTTWFDPQGSLGASIQNGITPDDIEASVDPDATVPDAGRTGLVEIPLNADTIQSWANGSLDNYGWSIISNSGSLWGFNSSEAFLPGTVKPELTILYTDPGASATGEFGIATDEVFVNEDSTATVTINRIGGLTGSATVGWELTAGTADAADVSSSLSGSVTFADGEAFKTFDIAINDDLDVEANETMTISLTGSESFTRDSATLTIRDNDFNPFAGDLLLNELWINSPGNDPPHEFVELTGTPGVGMGSLYYVAVEGLVGDRTGVAEKVVDIGAYTNGDSGFTVLTPDAPDFAFNVPADTTQIDALGSIGSENVASQNDSTTYMLLWSPNTRLTETSFDYDWDDDGGLDLPPGVVRVDTVGVRVLGASDQLYGPGPSVATFGVNDTDVDAISRTLGNTTRESGAAWYGGDLFAAGDDYLMYDPAVSFNVPVTGGALTPGEANTSPSAAVATLDSVTVNPDGTVDVEFSDPVTQWNVGNGSASSPGGAGFSITDTNGVVLTTVDTLPTVSGLGTTTITLSFTGSGVTNGMLPAGDYQLNFVGNGIIANGRVVDVAGDGSQINGSSTSQFTVTGGAPNGDFNGDGQWECADINALTTEIAAGTNIAAFDMNGDGAVDTADRDEWLAVAGPQNGFGGAFLLGDANLDGFVDVSDLNIWNQFKFQTNSNWCDGDFNADGFIDVSDLNIWNTFKFQSSDLAASLTGSDVAETKGAAVLEQIAATESVDAEVASLEVKTQTRNLRDSLANQRVKRDSTESSELSLIDRVFASFDA